MKLIIAFVVIFPACLANPIETIKVSSNETTEDSARIVGGFVAPDGAYPFIVSLRVRNSHFCGGSIISTDFILTAAHCVHGMSSPMTAVAGTNKLNSGGVGYSISSAMYHSLYDPRTNLNDIALLQTASPISFNLKVQPIKLSSNNPAAGQSLIAIGWGLTSYPGNIPNDLQHIGVTALDLQTCAQRLQGANPIASGHVCTTSPVNQGLCQGDSGGPLIDRSTGTIVGLVSWGIPCAKGLPDVFTSVAFYRDYITRKAIANV